MRKSQAKKNFEKGSANQRKSRDYIINHPLQYGILDEGRICIVRAGIGSNDFFSVCYDKRAMINTEKKSKIDPDGDPVKMALRKIGMYMKDIMAGFDIIATPYPIPGCVQDTFWIQVKTNKEPEEPYMNCLRKIEVPIYVKKEMHIWHDGIKEPQIIKL